MIQPSTLQNHKSNEGDILAVLKFQFPSIHIGLIHHLILYQYSLGGLWVCTNKGSYLCGPIGGAHLDTCLSVGARRDDAWGLIVKKVLGKKMQSHQIIYNQVLLLSSI